MPKSSREKFEAYSETHHAPKPPEDADKGPSVSDINRDPKLSGLFAEYLQNTGDDEDKELAQRMLERKMEDGDLETLQARKDAFLEKKKRIDETLEKLSPEYLIKLADHSEDLKNLIKEIKPAEMKTILAAHLEKLAMQNEDHYLELVDKMEQVEKLEEEGIKRYEKLEELAAIYHIPAGALEKVMREKDEAKRHEALGQLARQGIVSGELPFWRRPGTKNQKARERADEILESDELDELNIFSKEVQLEMNDIAAAIYGVLKGVPEIWDQAQKVIAGEKVEEAVGKQEEKMTLAEAQRLMAEYRKARETEEYKKMPNDDQRRKKFQESKPSLFKKVGGWYHFFNGLFSNM